MTGQSAALCQRLHRLAGEQVLRELPDQELVGRFAGQRDESAFAALVRRHGPMVLGVCRRVLHDGHAAEDAFQATFLVLARRAGELRRGEAVSGWLYGVAYRVARKARTAAARRCAREQAAPPRPGGADPAEEISLREARAIFDEELARLPQRYQAPLVLCCLEGLARDEAAARLGWPPGTLKSRLQSARRLLHARLTRRGLTLSAGLFTTLAAEGARAALPAALLRGAGDAARAATASGAAAVPVPAKVAALADGVLRTTFPARWKIALALVLAGGTGTGVILAHTQGQKPDDDDRPAAAARGEEAPGRTDRFGDPLPQGAVARLGTERFRHEDMIWAAAVSPDGKLVAGTGGRSLSLWETGTGKVVLRLPGHAISTHTLAFSPDGKVLATGGRDNLIRLWDVPPAGAAMRGGGEGPGAKAVGEVGRLEGHQDPAQRLLLGGGVNGLVFTPDGKHLVSTAADQTIRLWDVAARKELRRFAGFNGPAYSLTVSPDGKHLAAATGQDVGGEVLLWDVASGEVVRRWKSEKEPVSRVAFSPDGKSLVAGLPKDEAAGDCPVVFWDVATGRVTLRLSGQKTQADALVFSEDGTKLVTGGAYPDMNLWVWDVRAGKLLRTVRTPHAGYKPVGLLGDGRIAACVGAYNMVAFFDLPTGQRVWHTDGHHAGVHSVFFLPDKEFVLTADFGNTGGVRLWETGRWTEQGRLEPAGPSPSATAVAISPDGKLVGVGCTDAKVSLWDPAARRLVRRVGDLQGWVQQVAFSPDGKLVAAAATSNLVQVWDIPAGKKVREWRSNSVHGLAFSANGKTLAVVSGADEHCLHLRDVATGADRTDPGVREIDGSGINAVSYTPNGRTLVTAHMSDKVRLWEADTRRLRLTIDHPGNVTALAVSPDGRLLATANNGSHRMMMQGQIQDVGAEGRTTVRVWSLLTGRELHRFEGHAGGVQAVSFSPDGKLLASAGRDTTALIWDLGPAYRALEKDLARSGGGGLSGEQLQALWRDLESGDAGVAYRAVAALAADPRSSVPFLREQLTPPPVTADPARIAALVADLGSDRFDTREQATRELRQLGEAAGPALRKALKDDPSPEVRRRVEQLLAGLDGSAAVRALRALEVLEQIGGTPEVRKALEALAVNAGSHRVATAAEAALKRLGEKQ